MHINECTIHEREHVPTHLLSVAVLAASHTKENDQTLLEEEANLTSGRNKRRAQHACFFKQQQKYSRQTERDKNTGSVTFHLNVHELTSSVISNRKISDDKSC